MNIQEINEQKKSYTGTKTLNAFPMNRADYNTLRGWELADNEDGMDEGYLVEYPDSNSNVEGFEGYISWSPKDVFERSYFENIKPKGITVDPQIIEDEIASDTYTILPSGRAMICELILKNGFIATGSAIPVDPNNFDEAVGKKVSRQKAIDSLFPIFAYQLSNSINVRDEYDPFEDVDPAVR